MLPIKNLLCIASTIAICVANYNTANASTDGKAYIAGSYGIGVANKFNYDPDLTIERPKNSQIFGVAFGYQFNDNIRAELAVNNFNNFKYKNYNQLDDEDGNHQDNYFYQKISSNSLFANFYYDVNKFEKFKPYLSIGVGVSQNKSGNFNRKAIDNGEIEDNHTLYQKSSKKQFAWNVGAGISYEVNNKVTLDLVNYKYYDLGKTSTKPDEVGDSMKSKLKVHSITTGIRIKI